ncbi:MAG: alpha-glucan family phosphorylase [Phycisphaerae bacterium]|nr:alpha-glucan family phosphorylase [Phycisphaerae bacterium]
MAFKDLFIYPKYPDHLKPLFKLAYNLWCTWSYDAVNLFYRIDARRFREMNHNPVKLLLNLPSERIEELANDSGFLFEMERVWDTCRQYMSYEKTQNGDNPMTLKSDQTVAYFSMEFGLHECIPVYGGGLGILAGDFLKAASDLNMPFVGVGLIYKYGYFTQKINMHGMQEEQFQEFDNHQIPMRMIRDDQGGEHRIHLNIGQNPLVIRLWRIRVGKIPLILLDTDLEENAPDLRNITDELYVSDREKRFQQEFVLGVGGALALRSLGIQPRIYHINEGHSALLVLARLRELMHEKGFSYDEAKAMIRASSVFTTHTPVIAGNENFDIQLAQKYIEPEAEALGLSFETLAQEGVVGGDKTIFWMPAFAIKFSRYINGVSKLHGEVSKRMWADLFPEHPEAEIPITSVTNGVHSHWLSEPFTDLLTRYIGPDFVHQTGLCDVWNTLNDIPDEQIWESHRKSKHNLIIFIRNKLMNDLVQQGFTHSKSQNLGRLLSPDRLTIVFARRFAKYKRPTLLLNDQKRLIAILSNPERPVQLIFAGKAHPADTLGKDMIKAVIDFAKDNGLEDRVLFLENYDINVARHLAWGADVWLNNPIRPMEASGTSGMKAAINGVLNLSVPDGWWPEVYNGKNGWSITAGQFYEHSELKEQAEANQIYDLLEREITTSFYDRNESGIPEKWVHMMKESICTTSRFVNMNRVLIDYQNQFYTPSLGRSTQLAGHEYHLLRESVAQQQALKELWPDIHFVSCTTNADTRKRLLDTETLEAACQIDLGQAHRDMVSVEMYYEFDGQYQVTPLTFQNQEGSIASYTGSTKLQGVGRQRMNVRVRPTNEILQDLNPAWIKWA